MNVLPKTAAPIPTRRRAEQQVRTRNAAVWWFCAAVFLLCSAPRLRFYPAGPPLYVLDFLLLAAWVASIGRSRPSSPMVIWVLILAGFAVAGEATGAVLSKEMYAPVYMLTRTLLAMSLVLLLPKAIHTGRDLLLVLKSATLGITITAVLTILVSLSFTRGYVLSWVFSNPWLEPATLSIVGRLEEVGDRAWRGRSLVGVSNMSGAFLAIVWPLTIFVFRWPGISHRWRSFLLVVALLCPVAMLLTYSRAAYVGIILSAAALGLFGRKGGRETVLLLTLIVLGTFTVLGWGSEMFFFERVTSRTKIMLEGDFSDARERERLHAYSEPFKFLAQNPVHLVRGEGLAVEKLAGRGELESGERLVYGNLATHSVFAFSFYTYGALAAFSHVVLLGLAGWIVWRHSSVVSGSRHYLSSFPGYVLASYFGMLPWWLFGHGAVSQPRGAMMYFFLMGLVSLVPVMKKAGRRRLRV